MDTKLERLVSDYHARVAEAVDLLEDAGIMRPTSATEWAVRDMAHKGQLGDGFSYAKHGFGCTVRGCNWSVDFDFGASGQLDGVDPWRLWSFSEGRYFKTQAALDRAFQEAMAASELVKRDHLYYLAPHHPTR